MNTTCPSCHQQDVQFFYRVERAPVHSVLLHKSRQEAQSYPCGEIHLAFCPQCGFIFNAAYDPAEQEYDAEYESTQSYSPTFDSFSEKLARDLSARYDLSGKQIIEIGCGMGEFLSSICRLGGNRGLGFDPAYQAGRVPPQEGVAFVKDFYSEAYAHQRADFLICKMTLEHIPAVADFVGMVRAALIHSPQAVVYFQVPAAERILEDVAFWDIYYEHCSYFTAGSLAHLFQRNGFDVLRLSRAYNEQYLTLEARLADGQTSEVSTKGFQTNNITQRPQRSFDKVALFQERIGQRLATWREFLSEKRRQGQRVALWGGGSKAVAFLTTLGLTDEIAFCVDINPHKRGTFTAGSGHEIIAPADLPAAPPEVVIVLNPIYIPEIRQSLRALNLNPEIIPITNFQQGG